MPESDEPKALIGVFDSGVGGLSILSALRERLPSHAFYYVADQAHIPYGSRSPEEVRAFAEGITRFLLAQGAALIVVACNTATTLAISALRRNFPLTAFVGVEPALKPAVAQSRSHVVGVLATAATLSSDSYRALRTRYAGTTTLLENACPGLVEAIEQEGPSGPSVQALLGEAVEPMREQGADCLVLGCTHFLFTVPLLQRLLDRPLTIIEPATAVARRTAQLLDETVPDRQDSVAGSLTFGTTADPQRFRQQLGTFLGGGTAHAQVQPLRWVQGAERLDLSALAEKD